MTDPFDVYHQFLGIPPHEQPPNHYRLLGISLFEPDPEVIANAVSRQMRFVREVGAGEYSDAAQRLLNELAAAKICLLNQAKRLKYDAQLQTSRGSSTAQPRPDASATRFHKDVAVTFEADRIHPGCWISGNSSECDIVIDRPTVSRIHCCLEATPKGLFVTDKDSRNGTFVNGQSIHQRTNVRLADVVTLGRQCVLPWPSAVLSIESPIRVIRIGRDITNDLVLPDKSVSAWHAQVTVFQDRAVVQDLGSANGTSIHRPDRRITCGCVDCGGTVYFGGSLLNAKVFWD